jgi:hypothetical protein
MDRPGKLGNDDNREIDSAYGRRINSLLGAEFCQCAARFRQWQAGAAAIGELAAPEVDAEGFRLYGSVEIGA